MTVWIGVDEAGYGPNLGPLVVCASVWSAPSQFKPDSWVDQLHPVIRRADPSSRNCETGIVIDDSKKVYQSGKGLQELERHVLALTQLCGEPVSNADLFRRWLDDAFCIGDTKNSWRKGSAAIQPISDCVLHTKKEISEIRSALLNANLAVKRFVGRLLFPNEFNGRLSTTDNKAAVLSETTIALVSRLISQFESELSTEDLIILCDKHGGRDRYFALLCHFFPEAQVRILNESEEESVYRWTTSRGMREIRFCAKAERFPPTAAASMMAKYVRELCMAEWNTFWSDKIPGLAPTAGYPVDAKRYRLAISAMAKELGYDESDYWRRK